ncbi:UDP-N-acetylmuramoyl-tripeptide--D-alanyl-D-alanine ligase [Candidatus Desantisbacteria bacterium]|nr:UDP-N-acetylmuramoyl-tripeptide--D-alanyl-D-alanine ligase [Candidatus Desantisbacteria bacterium]
MIPINIDEILTATKGELVCGDREWFLDAGVSIDSRLILPGQLFIAIKGENFDGHDFIGEVIDKGASGVIFSDELGIEQNSTQTRMSVLQGVCAIRVKDTTAALGHLAAYYRNKFDIPIIGITGSNGKTTTKEMLSDVLSKQWRVLRNKKNFNNAIGLPLTLLEMDSSTQFCVVELGMNHPGEITYLTNIAGPAIGVITNVAESHIGHFEDKKAIARAKFELIEAMGEEGIAVLNADDPFVARMAQQHKGTVITFGIDEKADIFAIEIRENDAGVSFNVHWAGGKIQEMFIPIPGRHNVYNALAVCGVLVALGLDLSLAALALSEFKLPDSRMEITERAGIRIINDAYNANPGSMKAALLTLKGLACSGRRIMVMGDMLELGKWSKSLHEEMGQCACDTGVDILVTVGQDAAFAASEAKVRGVETFVCKDNEEALSILKGLVKPDDAVLIKGSRGMRMERIVEGLVI